MIRTPLPDPTEIVGLRRYRDRPSFGSDKKPGSGFSGAGGDSPTTPGSKPAGGGVGPTVRPGSGGVGADQKPEPMDAGSNTPTSPGSKTAERPKASKQKNSGGAVGMAGSMLKSSGKGKDDQTAGDKLKEEAADKAQKSFEKMASKGGGWGKAAAAASKVLRGVANALGVKQWQLIAIVVIINLLITLMPFLLIIFFWEHPALALGLAIKVVGNFLGFGLGSVITTGAAGRLAYEVPVTGNGVAQAAISNYNPATLPRIGTYAYKLSQIDWEKAKYQTIPNQSACNVVTQRVQKPDGTTRSVIDRVEIKDNPSTDLIGVARANCLDNVYPIFNTLMRSQFIRENINEKVGIRYAYAAQQDSTEFSGKTRDEIGGVLRNKTLSRIWQRSGNGVTGYTSELPNSQASVASVCRPEDTACILNLFAYLYKPDSTLKQASVDCANNFDFTDPKTIEKAINKAKHDLQCGLPPDKIKFMYQLPTEADALSSNAVTAATAKITAIKAMCELYTRTQEDSDTAIDRYKKYVEQRISSEANSAFQAMTYASTNRARFLKIEELNGDAYKVLGMGNAQEYQFNVNREIQGQAIDADAASRIVGIANNTSRNGVVYNDASFVRAQAVLNRLQSDSSACSAVLDEQSFNNIISATNGTGGFFATLFAGPLGASITQYYDSYYPQYKEAIATLDFYSRNNKGTKKSIQEAARGVTLEQIFIQQVKIESNASTAGSEEGIQNFNRMGIGMKAYKNSISIALGGSFLNENQAVAQENMSGTFIAYEDSSKGLLWRLFNQSNPRSITSRFSVALIDKPDRVASNVASLVGGLFNPAKNLVGSKSSLAYMITGKSNIAQASSSYEINSLRIDPAGVPQGFFELNPLEIAATVEGLQQNNTSAQEVMTQWDACFKEYIPSRFHLIYPDTEKASLYTNYCRELFDISAPSRLNDNEKSIARAMINSSASFSAPSANRRILSYIYRAYHFYNLQADAMLYLSDPNKEDPSYNATANRTETAEPAESGDEAVVSPPITQPGSDTSALPCPTGTTDGGVGEKKGANGEVQYTIRLCRVRTITVNVSIAANLRDLLIQASSDGINFGGYGYRTFERQVTLRQQHGCASPSLPPSACSPPTARPGSSNHESGEAIDFTVGGRTIRSRSAPSFLWLRENAARYGLLNLPSEPWHWSRNGR